MKRCVRGLRDWTLAVGFALIGGLGLTAADRPPVSDQPWPVEEPGQLEPAPIARPITGRTVKLAPNKARPGVTQNASARSETDRAKTARKVSAPRESTPAIAKAPSQNAARSQPVGSGVRTSAQRSPSGSARPTNGYVPLHDRQVRRVQYGPSSDEVFEEVQGEMVFEDGDVVDPLFVPSTESDMFLEDECDFCGEGCGHRSDCCLVPCPPWGSLQAFFGTQGFTGPLNIGETGSFGFQEGLNYGSKLPWGLFPSLGWQAGVRFTQSDLSGSELTNTRRGQTFFTAGLFRRVDQGLQMGVVFDQLHEQWYGEADLNQVRAELGWVHNTNTEYGFWCAVRGREKAPIAGVPLTPAVTSALNTVWTPTDMYLGYVKRYFGSCEHGYARAFAGATGVKDGILGADAMLPMTDQWSFQAGFTYLIPEQSAGSGTNSGHAQESWNLGVSLVWTPGRPHIKNYYRPLFSVADNGSFLVDRR